MLAAHLILADVTGTMGLVGLIGVFMAIVWWGWYCRELKAAFHRNLAAAGFDREIPTPPLVAAGRPWLKARLGSPPLQNGEVLFLLGLSLGPVMYTSHGSSRPLEPFQGFVLPVSSKLTPSDMETLRQTYRKNLVTATTLSDGTHFFLWMRAHNPRQLAGVLTMLKEVERFPASS